MYDFSIYDLNFNSITNFWQYDYGISIIVKKFSDITEFHFSNKLSEEAIIVIPQVLANGYAVSVPDLLLKQSFPILIYAYCRGEDGGVTIQATKIPVRKRPMPNSNSNDIQDSNIVILQPKIISPTENVVTVTADSGYTGLSRVVVDAVSNTYVGSGIPQKASEIYIPNTADQVIASGQYLKEAQIIKGDSNLISENIKDGISIFGVDGTFVGTPYPSIEGVLIEGNITVSDDGRGNVTILNT